MSAQITRLSAHRVHLHHGPIDCIVEAHGQSTKIESALAAAAVLFPTILPNLVANLANLRAKIGTFAPQVLDETAQRMIAACWPHREQFITPMAAVAGSVADTLLAHMLTHAPTLTKAFVNNGGDIAFHLSDGETFRVGLAPSNGIAEVPANWGVCGIATSGWPGRSQSLGIADAVTVFARDAATADAAATMIANAVNVEHPLIERKPATAVKDDSDLGDIPVTVFVPTLEKQVIDAALSAGERAAQLLVTRGIIHSAVLQCQGQMKYAQPINVVHQTSPLTLLAA